MRNVLNILDLTTEEIDELISVAEDIAALLVAISE